MAAMKISTSSIPSILDMLSMASSRSTWASRPSMMYTQLDLPVWICLLAAVSFMNCDFRCGGISLGFAHRRR